MTNESGVTSIDGGDGSGRAQIDAALDGARWARWSAERGNGHVRAEQTNDLAAIMGTISPDPFFPMLDHDGAGQMALQLLTDTPSVERYYADRHGSYEIVASRQIAATTTELYTFRESVATLRPVGEIDGARSDGSLFQVNSAVLFPTCAEGIGGELVWTRYPFGDVVAGRVTPPEPLAGPAHLPNERLRAAEAHEAYLDAWRAGDPAAMADRVAHDGRWQRRLRGADSSRAIVAHGTSELRDLFAVAIADRPPRAVEVLNRLVTEWYVFCDLYLEIDLDVDGSGHVPVVARHVALHPVGADGRLRAELGDLVVLDDTSRP